MWSNKLACYNFAIYKDYIIIIFYEHNKAKVKYCPSFGKANDFPISSRLTVQCRRGLHF